MLAIDCTFLARRFHATPWGSHVNEGVPEWPPSPWRILRALAAAWLNACPERPREAVQELLHTLAAPPGYHLPPAAVAHTRHYMPWYKKGPDDRVLVFDTFVLLGAAERSATNGRREDDRHIVQFQWAEVSLSEEQAKLLDHLLLNVRYLGRSESWVEMRRSEEIRRENGRLADLQPVASSQEGEQKEGETAAKVLAAERPLDLAALCVSTDELRRAAQIEPPGSYWLRYVVPEFVRPVAARRRRSAVKPTTMRFAIGGTVRPLMTEALSLAETMHQSAAKKYDRLPASSAAAAPQQLTGLDKDGEPLKEQHRHAHYLVTDEDGDGRADHLTVWAPGGLAPAEVQAAALVRQLVAWDRCWDVPLSLIGYGTAATWASRLAGPSMRWVSLTPFLLNRHPKVRRGPDGKKRWVDSPIDQIAQEMRYRAATLFQTDGPPETLTIQPVRWYPIGRSHSKRGIAGEAGATAGRLMWLDFRRWRSGVRRSKGEGKAAPPALNQSFGFLLTFSRPVNGPIALGYGCHFGLGLFVPLDVEPWKDLFDDGRDEKTGPVEDQRWGVSLAGTSLEAGE